MQVIENGVSYCISRDGVCSCGITRCKHMAYARLWESAPNQHFLFTSTSGLHKEIRRGDYFRAAHYADLISAKYGDKYVDAYLRKICLEETRNLGLFQFVMTNSWRSALRQLTNAEKKWCRYGYSQTLRKANAVASIIISNQDAKVQPLSCNSFDSGVATLHAIRKLSNRKKVLREMASDLLNDATSDAIRLFLELCGSSWRYYQWILLLEERFNIPQTAWQPYPNVPRPLDVDPSALMLPASYCFDIHTSQGKRQMRRHWADIKPGRPMPGGLDLRFSGGILFTAWRERAFAKFGETYTEASWESINFSEEEWKALKIFDAMFYGDFYAEVEPDVLADVGQLRISIENKSSQKQK